MPAPVITSQPSNQTTFQGIPFTVSVTATGATSYQWYRGDPTNGASGVQVSGATAASYTNSSPAPADAGAYYVGCTNVTGTTFSTEADVTVTPITNSGFVQIYNENYAAQATASAPAAGQQIYGLEDVSGGNFSNTNGVGLSFPSTGSPYSNVGIVPYSNTQQNSSSRIEIPVGADPSKFGYGPIVRALPWSGTDTRYSFYEFAIFGNTAGFGPFSIIQGVLNNGGNQTIWGPSYGLSWFDNTKAYYATLTATGSSPTTLRGVITEVLTGTVVLDTTAVTDSEALFQGPGYAGVHSPSYNGQQGTGPSIISSLVVSLESAVAEVVGTIAEGASTTTANVIVLGATGGTGPYTYQVWGVKDNPNFTPGSGNLLTGTSNFTTSDGSTYTHSGLSSTSTDGDLWFYVAAVTDSASHTSTCVSENGGNPNTIAPYLIVQVKSPSRGSLTALNTKFSGGQAMVHVTGNSLIGSVGQDSDTQTTTLESYLLANGLSAVYVDTKGWAGSALGNDWGSGSSLFTAGGNGPNGASVGPYGTVGNNPAKNLLANTVDWMNAGNAAHPGVPGILVFFELTNTAQQGQSLSAAVTEWEEIVAAVTSAGWQVIIMDPAWIVPLPADSSTAALAVEVTGFLEIRADASTDGVHAFAGYRDGFYKSFANSNAYFDAGGVHMQTAGYTDQGNRWGEDVRRQIMGVVGSNPTITTQPSNQTVTAGQTATFSVSASNATGYQAQSSTNNGSTWTNITGATSNSYTTPTLTTANSGTQYRFIVSNGSGSTTSNAVTLTVNASGGSSVTNPGVIQGIGGAVRIVAAAGEQILFTLDGTTPNATSSPQVGLPFRPNSVLNLPVGNTTIKAVAFVVTPAVGSTPASITQSSVTSATFTQAAPTPQTNVSNGSITNTPTGNAQLASAMQAGAEAFIEQGPLALLIAGTFGNIVAQGEDFLVFRQNSTSPLCVVNGALNAQGGLTIFSIKPA